MAELRKIDGEPRALHNPNERADLDAHAGRQAGGDGRRFARITSEASGRSVFDRVDQAAKNLRHPTDQAHRARVADRVDYALTQHEALSQPGAEAPLREEARVDRGAEMPAEERRAAEVRRADLVTEQGTAELEPLPAAGGTDELSSPIPPRESNVRGPERSTRSRVER